MINMQIPWEWYNVQLKNSALNYNSIMMHQKSNIFEGTPKGTACSSSTDLSNWDIVPVKVNTVKLSDSLIKHSVACTAQMLSNEQMIHFAWVFTNKSVYLYYLANLQWCITRGVFTLMTGNEWKLHNELCSERKASFTAVMYNG